jgi:hypothetical protein
VAPALSGCLGFSLPRTALADPVAFTSLERRTIAESLPRVERGLEVEPAPEGKRIERVDIVTLEVFDEHDPIPNWVNLLHGTTREAVVRRELLFGEGEAYQQPRVDETARNLRGVPQLSLVLIVPVRGSSPDRVRVVVIVRDVWSLRLNWGASVVNTKLAELTLNPSEENLLGTHLNVGGLFQLDPGTYSFGGVATQRRILGTQLEASLSANLIYGRNDGRPEGSYGYFSYRLPLLSSRQSWAFGTSAYWWEGITRRYVGTRVRRFDAEATPEDDAIPVVYHSDRIVGGFEAVRSVGTRIRSDFSAGFDIDRRAYRHDPAPDESPEAEREFARTWLPVSDTRMSPVVQVRTREERFLRTAELETLGLEENFRLGPEALLRLYPASRALGSSRTLLGSFAALSYTAALGDGLARALVEHTLEHSPGSDVASFRGRLRVASPRFALGRFIADGSFLDRYRNYLNRRVTLGGDGRLRGYAPGQFSGTHALAFNAEFRSRAIDIISVQVGLAAYYDAGDAADRVRALSLKQSAGLGLRILIPQFDRTVFRIDWAAPLSPGYAPLPGAVYATFDQAFGMPELGVSTLAAPVTCHPCDLPE